MLPSFLAAALPDRPPLWETLGYQLNGLIVVFVALGLIWGLLEVLGLFFRRAAPKPAPAAAVAPPAATGPSVPSAEMAPELVAVITAAVHLTFGGRARIQAIVPVEHEQGWAREGRRQIFSSHQVR